MDVMTDAVGLTVASMQNDVQRMNMIANHAANALTPGFKRSLVAVANQSPPVGASVGLATVPVQTAVLDTKPGIPRKTGLPLDLSIVGDGYFEVKTESGYAYTRLGAFHLDGRGRLITQAGDPVLGTGGEITLTSTSPVIDRDGKVYEKGVEIGQLKLVSFADPNQLQSIGNGKFMAPDGVLPQELSHPQILQGHLESSNVDSTREMASIIETYRHFETSQRLLQIYDDLRDKTFRSLGQF